MAVERGDDEDVGCDELLRLAILVGPAAPLREKAVDDGLDGGEDDFDVPEFLR